MKKWKATIEFKPMEIIVYGDNSFDAIGRVHMLLNLGSHPIKAEPLLAGLEQIDGDDDLDIDSTPKD